MNYKPNKFFWEKIYNWLKSFIELSFYSDNNSALLLRSFLLDYPRISLEEIYSSVEGKKVIVIAGSKCYEDYINCKNPNEAIIFVADKGIKCLSRNDIKPTAIITDLDGINDNILFHPKYKNSYFFIHAHGDNQELIKKYLPSIMKQKIKIIGTTQTKPFYPLFNFGGFTDGDRTVFTALFFKAKEIEIYGIGEEYFNIDVFYNLNKLDIKAKKFLAGYLIINWLKCKWKYRISIPYENDEKCLEIYPWEE
ncbi:MAG: 6-hydroxymethylpterin diphosphokinase MptE-like protein [Fervidicoccus sp.]|uniref:6-hydroxymethylpterin diphosphokinase MptE-like protein n=1 Tax=Fervidicoccus fontis TaxID=683846 RepID=UPI0011E528C2|nr:6-hydroxymethylpterin diphosphokinase MptE-like protein [Fervidicoccus fontis]